MGVDGGTTSHSASLGVGGGTERRRARTAPTGESHRTTAARSHASRRTSQAPRRDRALLEENRHEVLAVAHALETHKTLSGEDVVGRHRRAATGPLVDGRVYHEPESAEQLEAYHAASWRPERLPPSRAAAAGAERLRAGGAGRTGAVRRTPYPPVPGAVPATRRRAGGSGTRPTVATPPPAAAAVPRRVRARRPGPARSAGRRRPPPGPAAVPRAAAPAPQAPPSAAGCRRRRPIRRPKSDRSP